MFSSDAKAATLLESYQVLAEEVSSLAEMEASYDVPDEDVAEAITHLGRAMRCVAGARAFCVDLCETPKSECPETYDRPDFLTPEFLGAGEDRRGEIGVLTRGLLAAQESLCRHLCMAHDELPTSHHPDCLDAREILRKPPGERYVSGCSFDAALARAARAGAEAAKKAIPEVKE